MSFSKSNVNWQFQAPQIDPSLVDRYPDVGQGLDRLFNQYQAMKQMQRAEQTAGLQNQVAQQQIAAGQRQAQMADINETSQFGAPLASYSPQQIQQAGQGFAPQGPGLDPANERLQKLAQGLHAIGERTKMASQTQQAELDKTKSEAARNYATAGDSHYTLDQAASLIAPNGESPDKSKAELAKLYPDGKIPKDYTHTRATNNRFEGTLGEKQSQFDTKQWEEINRKTNPAVAGPRTLVGMAGTLNAKADRALKNLNDPNATPQQIAGAVADTASILAGGAADDHAIKSQTYDTLQTRLANLNTLITSKPSKANQPDVVEQLKKVIQDIREVDNKVITDNLNTYENIHSDTIKRNPEKWATHKANILKSAGVSDGAGEVQTRTLKDGSTVKVRPDGKGGWVEVI